MSNESSTSRTRRVLVAEDETLIRLDIVETLTEAGYTVVAEAADCATNVVPGTRTPASCRQPLPILPTYYLAAVVPDDLRNTSVEP